MAGPVTPAMQRAGPIAGLGDVLREFGVPAETVTAGTGIDLEGLTAESRIPFSAVLTLLERAASQSRCHHLGLLLGARYAVLPMERSCSWRLGLELSGRRSSPSSPCSRAIRAARPCI